MEHPNEQSKLRKYILNDVGEDERSAIDERLLADDEYFEEVLIAEESLIQDYADGKLVAADHEKFEKHFLCSEENRRKVKFARALRKYVDETGNQPEPAEKPRFFDSLKAFLFAPIPAALTILVIAGIVGLLVWKYSSHDSESLIALNKAFENARPSVGRITDFKYAPKIEGTRGGDKNENLNLVLAKSRATEAVLKNETAENLHDLGRVFLAEGRFDEAIQQFEKALKKNPKIAKVHNDLGVALMEKGRQKEEGTLELFAQAHQEIEKSIELDNGLTEAYFNRGLVIELLKLPNQAAEAWENYLKIDNSSRWANEAREHLEKLKTNTPITKTKEEILQDFLEAKSSNNREKAWLILSRSREIPDKLIPQQLTFLIVDNKSAGNTEKAREALAALVYIGNLEEEKSGDLYWRDLANYYERLSDDKIPVLKQAQDFVRNGYQFWFDRKLEKSSESLKLAIETFTKAENNLETKICEYLIINNLFQLNKVKESNELYLELAESSRLLNYKWIATQSYVRLAYGTGSENKVSQSIEFSNKALELAKQTEDIYNLQRIFSILADRYRQLGRYDLSLNFSEKSLKITLLPESSQRQKWTDYDAATQIFFAKRFLKTADVFQKEALDLSRKIKMKYFEQVSNFYLGMIYSANGQYSKAEEFFNESIEIAKTFEDPQVRLKNLALAKLRQADFKRVSGKYEEAIAIYNEVNEFHTSSEFQRDKYACQKGQLLCYLQMRDDAAIQKQLPLILEIFKKYRKEILEEQNRNAFFDQNQDVYDLAINYEYDNANYERAFDYSENSRSRTLLDLINSDKTVFESQPEIKIPTANSEPLKLAEIQSQIPDRVQIIQYSVLHDKVIIWLITKNNFQAVHTEIKIQELQEIVFSYLDLLKKYDVAAKEKEIELSRRLYELLFRPIDEKIDTQKEICFIPDKFLFHLPFAALTSTKNERYLISDYNISYAPSANIFLISTARAEQLKNNSVETLLSIGNPAFSQKKYSDFQKLPSAEKEAREIRDLYPKSVPLIGVEATKNIVKENFTTANVVHFAGHYTVNERFPSLSGFLLAENRKVGDKEDSLLTNYEVLGMNLSKIRLIVLSACETGVEGFYQGEGIIGASRTFLAGKVPLVVASQWAVDSEATNELMVSFHRIRKGEKSTTVAALRKAQLDLLNSQNKRFQHPYFWAGFMTLGGYAEF